MPPACTRGAWVVFTWMLILLWDVTCVQGVPHNSEKRINKNIENAEIPLVRERRDAEVPLVRNKRNADIALVRNKRNEEFEEQENTNAEYESFEPAGSVEVHSNVPPPLETDRHVLETEHHTNVPPPLETDRHVLETVSHTSNVPPPLLNNEFEHIPEDELQKLESDLEQQLAASRKKKKQEASKNVQTKAEIATETIEAKEEKVTKRPEVATEKTVSDDRTEQEGKDTQQTIEKDMNLKPQNVKKTDKNKQNKEEKEPKQDTTPQTDNDIKVDRPLKLVTVDQFIKQNPELTIEKENLKKFVDSSKNKVKTLSELQDMVKEKHKQSLNFLKNATKQADDLQKTLKSHKLKLKSYMDVLKNLTVQNAEDRKKMENYTKSVHNKVNDILNPTRRLDNSVNKTKKAEKVDKLDKNSLKDGQRPKHFLAKNITETLRARVNMKDLKKSEQFWDKKGADIEEPHVLKLEAYRDGNVVDDDKSVIDQADSIESQTILTELIGEEAVEEFPELNEHDDTLPEAHPLSFEAQQQEEEEVHAAVLEDTPSDRLAPSRTQHEQLIFNQVISGRIHGNVLAPPPERCSVPANMARYRPPEDEMDEDDSLLYRVDLEPEYEKALEGGPLNYLSDYKNPCWLSKISDDKGMLWYDYTESGLSYKRMSFLYEMRLSKDSNWRMRCLPLLYFVGVTKSGTTDLYSRMMSHPEIMRPAHKEPMFWNRLTLGMAQSLRKPFRYYADFFDEAAELMRRKVVIKNNKPYHPGITVDATPANLWDYDCWTDIPGNRGLAEPKYTLAASIKKLVPNAKILMILREPTDRLYSQYRMKSHFEPSATFHKQVVETITRFNTCLETRTLRSCAYDHDLAKHEFGSPGGVFLRASLYYVFVKDWLEVFPPEQIKVLRTEDYQNDTEGTLKQVFDFLDLSTLSKEKMTAISKQKDVNTRSDHRDRSLEPILPETQKLLDDFFRPYNKLLAKLLKDKRFRWGDIKRNKKK